MVERPLSEDELNELARIRHEIHRFQGSHRPLSPNYEKIGLAGERAMAEYLGLEVDRSIKPHGSNSINFRVGDETINVSCAQNALYLLVEQGKAKADIYALALYLPVSGAAVLIGWATKADVLATTPADIGKRGILSHHIHHEKLRPMYELPPYLGLDIRR